MSILIFILRIFDINDRKISNSYTTGNLCSAKSRVCMINNIIGNEMIYSENNRDCLTTSWRRKTRPCENIIKSLFALALERKFVESDERRNKISIPRYYQCIVSILIYNDELVYRVADLCN